MSKVSHGDGVLLLDGGEEGTLVVDLKIEDAVLIWEANFGAVGCGVGCAGGGREGDAVEG